MNNKIRVGMMTTSFPVNSNLSSGIFVQCLFNAIDARSECECQLVTPSYYTTDIEDARVKLVRYAPKSRERVAHSPGGLPAALDQSKQQLCWLLSLLMNMFCSGFRLARNCHILHAHWSINAVLLTLPKWLLRKPLVTTLRGQDVNLSKTKKIFKILLDIAISNSDKLVCVGQEQLEFLQSRYPKYIDKLSFIANGVDEIFFEIGKEKKTEDFLKKEKIRLLTCSSLIQLKRIDTIIRSLSLLDQRFELWIMGDGPERHYLESLAQSLDVVDRTVFTGVLLGNNKFECWRQSDMFVFASESEGRANVLYEACAAKLPVVASDIMPNIEVLGDLGLYFPVGDAAALAQKIEQWTKDDQVYRDFIKSDSQSQVMSWQDSAQQYIDLYEALYVEK